MRYIVRYPKEEFQLTELQKGILESLIRNRELNRYELSKLTGHAYSAIYKATKFLLKNNVIEISKTEENKRNSRIEVDYYKIKYLGVTDFLKASGAELWPYSLRGESFASFIGNPTNYWHRIFSTLLRDHPYVFPPEFHMLSKELVLALCPEYFMTYAYTNEDPGKWPALSSLIDELDRRIPDKDQGTTNVPWAIQHLFHVFKLLIETKMNEEIPGKWIARSGNLTLIVLYDVDESYKKRLCKLMSERDLAIIISFVHRIASILKRNARNDVEVFDDLLTYLEGIKSDDAGNLAS